MSPAGAGPVRRSVTVAGLEHGDLPIPVASRVGSLIATGGIRGVHPQTGVLPDRVEDQLALMFDNLRTVVEAAGGSAGTVAKVTVWATDRAATRDALNAAWVALFPDPESRPARHVIQQPLPGGMLVQCEALAVAADGREG